MNSQHNLPRPTDFSSHSRMTGGAFPNLDMHPTPHTSLKTRACDPSTLIRILSLMRISSSVWSKAAWTIF
jgi:hypothetical protein